MERGFGREHVYGALKSRQIEGKKPLEFAMLNAVIGLFFHVFLDFLLESAHLGRLIPMAMRCIALECWALQRRWGRYR